MPGWQQPELAWLIGMPLGFAGPWLAGQLGAGLLAVPLALAVFLVPWAMWLRASALTAAQAALCAFALGSALAWIDGGLQGALGASPIEALGLPAPWLPDPGVALPAGGAERAAGRVALGGLLVALGWLLGRLGLGALVPLPVALLAAEFGAGFGRVAQALSADRIERMGLAGSLSDGAAALVGADPGSVALGLGATLAAGGLALAGRRSPGGPPDGPAPPAGGLTVAGLVVAGLGVPLALLAVEGYRAALRGWL